MATILCVDDEPAITTLLDRTLRALGHEPVAARNAVEALQALARGRIDLIISDYQMPGVTGLELLELIRAEGYAAPLIMLTGHASVEHAVAAIKAGAADYVAKPFGAEQLRLAVTQALTLVRLTRENDALRSEVAEIRNQRQLIGDSPQIRRLHQTIAAAAPTRATVLVQGESGTGKELVARMIHEQSDRRDKRFIQLNCAALPEGLIESALFGHERGAFTGALKRSLGAFERADGGTLLLDEISEMRLDLQPKLLRVLQEQEFERVGGEVPIRVDVRVIATTNRDLAAEAAKGSFRQDLYYRLNVLPICVPPLRDRGDDIALLARRFAARAAGELGREIDGISEDALELLRAHTWPGNVRELQHVVERAVILSTERVLKRHLFDALRQVPHSEVARLAPAAVPGEARGSHVPGNESGGGLLLHSLDLAEAEGALIYKALDVAGGNRTRAAALLGINVRTLRKKLNRAAASSHAPDD